MAWHIHTVGRMFADRETQTSAVIDGREVWVRAVCLPYHTFPIERVKAAWAVLTGKAHAVKWPKPGDLERVWYGPAANFGGRPAAPPADLTNHHCVFGPKEKD